MNPQEELDQINSKLEILLSHGSNDETLVDRKRELEKIIRNGSRRDSTQNSPEDT
jgi:hypothetical protein